jgi:hypothetical protein
LLAGKELLLSWREDWSWEDCDWAIAGPHRKNEAPRTATINRTN